MMEFRCAACGKVFLSDRSEEDAEEELRKNFGPEAKKENCVLICDTCYKVTLSTLN